jgi:hypothetical protein
VDAPVDPPSHDSPEPPLLAKEESGGEWYRLMLWAMPSCLVLASLGGYLWVVDHLKLPGGAILSACMILNPAAAAALGYFDAKLRFQGTAPSPRKFAAHTLGFVAVQTFLAPSLAIIASLIAGFR